MDKHDFKTMQNAILPDKVKMMVRNFQKKINENIQYTFKTIFKNT